MKIKFYKTDKIHKIFKSIEKLSDKKKIQIFIEEWNEIYENIWWWNQLIQLLDKKKIDFEIFVNWTTSFKYFNKLWVKNISQNINFFEISIYILKSYFFKIKDFHWDVFRKKTYFFYVILVLELISIWAIFYYFYNLITPSAKIYIQPTFSLDKIVYNFFYYPWNWWNSSDSNLISIPYYTWKIDLEYTETIDVANIKYIQTPSSWLVSFVNMNINDYSFVANTKLISDDWLLFRLPTRISVPNNDELDKNDLQYKVEAMDKDVDWQIIWQRWNIKKWTRLYFKNLRESYYFKNVYWEVLEDFKWWETNWQWTVSIQDIDIIKERLSKYVNENIMILLKNNFNSQNDKWKELLFFKDLISVQINDFIFNWNVWDNVSDLQWTIKYSIIYHYVNRNDLKKWILKYTDDRQSKNFSIIDLDKSSLIFYDKLNIDENFVIPTEIDVIMWYDFDNDINWILNEIKHKIVWKDLAFANDVIFSYKEIKVWIIKISPPWQNSLPNLLSRIQIIYEK